MLVPKIVASLRALRDVVITPASPYFRRLPSIPRWTEHGCQATLIPSVFQSYVSRDDVLLRITTWGSAESRTD